MKKILILFSTAVLLASCSAKSLLKPDPEVSESGTVSVSATISADHVWSGNDAVGIYGSLKGVNAKFVPLSSCFGKGGQATLYGSAVDGELVGYYPYSYGGVPTLTKGFVVLPQIQKYCRDAFSQITGNTVAVARGKDGILDMEYLVGVVHFKVSAKFSGEVKSVTLSSISDVLSGEMSIDDGSMSESGPGSVSVRGIGRREGEFDLWVMLPCGIYSGLELTIISDEGSVVKSVRGSIPVEKGRVSETVVKDEAFEYAGSDYEVIPGNFD